MEISSLNSHITQRGIGMIELLIAIAILCVLGVIVLLQLQS
ncbi:MAG: prepilin-type N-terminal cleavage/methylation domain-containing protein [Variovorax sp.]